MSEWASTILAARQTECLEREEFVVRATIVCQSRTKAEAIELNCRRAAETSLDTPTGSRERAYWALLQGWEGTTKEELMAFMRQHWADRLAAGIKGTKEPTSG